MTERKRAIQADMMLSIIRKCDLMDVSRSAMYYQPVERELDLEELEIKKRNGQASYKIPVYGIKKPLRSIAAQRIFHKPEACPKTHGCYEYSFNCT